MCIKKPGFIVTVYSARLLSELDVHCLDYLDVCNEHLKHLITRKKNICSNFKPVGEVSLPRRSWKRNSIRFVHQQIHSQHNCRPRIPHAQCPCGLSHRLLRSAVRGVNFFCRCCHVPCRLYHQWLLEPSTLHHWRWSTIVCSMHGSYWGEDYHSRRRAALSCLMFSWKHIPTKKVNKSNQNLQQQSNLPLQTETPLQYEHLSSIWTHCSLGLKELESTIII